MSNLKVLAEKYRRYIENLKKDASDAERELVLIEEAIEKNIITPYTIGRLYYGRRGIYAGTCDYEGKSHHVFAGPYDLMDDSSERDAMTWIEADKRVRELRDGWMLPTKEMLQNNLYPNRHAIGGFQTERIGLSVWYWSGTALRDFASCVWALRFADGEDDYNLKDKYRLSCRPVRVEVVNN